MANITFSFSSELNITDLITESSFLSLDQIAVKKMPVRVARSSPLDSKMSCQAFDATAPFGGSMLPIPMVCMWFDPLLCCGVPSASHSKRKLPQGLKQSCPKSRAFLLRKYCRSLQASRSMSLSMLSPAGALQRTCGGLTVASFEPSVCFPARTASCRWLSPLSSSALWNVNSCCPDHMHPLLTLVQLRCGCCHGPACFNPSGASNGEA